MVAAVKYRNRGQVMTQVHFMLTVPGSCGTHCFFLVYRKPSQSRLKIMHFTCEIIVGEADFYLGAQLRKELRLR